METLLWALGKVWGLREVKPVTSGEGWLSTCLRQGEEHPRTQAGGPVGKDWKWGLCLPRNEDKMDM